MTSELHPISVDLDCKDEDSSCEDTVSVIAPSKAARSLLSYLDSIEESSEDPADSGDVCEQPVPPPQPTPRQGHSQCSTHPSPSLPGMSMFDSVRERLVSLRAQAESERRRREAIENQLNQVRENHALEIARLEESEAQQRKAVREECESVVGRQLAFADALLRDKEQLSGECESLAAQLKDEREQWQKKESMMKMEHRRQLNQKRQEWNAIEKRKREKWRSKREMEIKEATVRGMEPEIQSLLQRHREQAVQAAAEHRRQLRENTEHCRREMEKEMSEMKKRLNEEWMMKMEQNGNEISERLERRREEEARLREREYEAQSERVRAQHQSEVERVRKELEQQLEAQRRLHCGTLKRERAQWEKEWEKRKDEMQMDQDKRRKEFEQGLKQRMENEQRMQLDEIIERMSKERLSEEDEIRKQANKDADYLRKELKEKSEAHSICLRKLDEIGKQKDEMEKEMILLKNELKVIHNELDQCDKENNKIKEQLKMEEQKMEISMCEANKRTDQVRIEMSELKLSHQKQLDRIQNDHCQSLVTLEERVRSAMQSKDQAISALKIKVRDSQAELHALQTVLRTQAEELAALTAQS